MINPLDVAKEVAAMAAVMGSGITSDKERVDVVELAIELWEKCYAINHCDACGNPYPDPSEETDPADAWKEGRNSDYVGPDADSDGLSPSEDPDY